MVFSRGGGVQASIHTSSIHLTYRFKMWGIWQWATWLYTSTGIRYTVPLSGSVSRVSQALSTTCTTVEDEADRHVSRALEHHHPSCYICPMVQLDQICPKNTENAHHRLGPNDRL